MDRYHLLSMLLLSFAAGLSAQPAGKESPLGLVLSAKSVDLVKVGSSLPLSAKPGDILFAGDSLKSKGGTARFLFCPDRTSQELSGSTEVTFDARQLKVRGGSLAGGQPASECFLPPMDRTIPTGQQDGGAERSRDLDSSPAGSMEQRIQALAPAARQSLLGDLAPIQKAFAATPNDPVLLQAESAILEKHGLLLDAAEKMRAVTALWPDAAWARSRLFTLDAARSAPPPPSQEPESGKNVFALLIGVSSFQSDQIRPLEFAHEDAISMKKLLQSPRGGGLPEENIKLLTNKEATSASIRSAIDSHLKTRGSTDTVLLFIASHGAAIDVNGRSQGFIITWDTDPEDVSSTAIAMEDIRRLFEQQLGGVRRLLLYVDVCRAGKIGQIVPDYRATNNVAQRLTGDENFFGMLAAQGKQSAIEGVNYGGGHGAFTYFLLRALNGDADLNRNGVVTMNELVDFVKEKVSEATGSRQIPKEIGETDETRIMAYSRLEGITLGDYAGPLLVAARGDRQLGIPPAPTDVITDDGLRSTKLKYQDAATVIADYERAIRDGHILPTDDNGAFKFLRALKSLLQDDDYQVMAEKLKVALEDKGQDLLVRYLAGEQTPLTRGDFYDGAQYFEAAELLARDSVFLEGRKVFCEGRVRVFNKDYVNAIDWLERAIRLDPDHAYAYNALGIALLEQADYDRAILAFRDAVSRAPFWAYPLHNQALAYYQKGDYSAAIGTYLQAMRLAPRYAYLPYNLGLVYQRLNRRKDAEAMYRKALSLRQDAETYNALGYLKFFEGKTAAAEEFYKTAVRKDPNLVIARHNYAVLLNTIPARQDEAFKMWREILTQHPDYTLSRLALAKAFDASGHHSAEAAGEFRLLLNQKPDYVAARMALAVLEIKLGNREAALEQLREAVRLEPENALAYEQIGDLETAAGRRAEASDAYKKALEYSTDRAARRKISRKSRT